jgi:hypothetical protein
MKSNLLLKEPTADPANTNTTPKAGKYYGFQKNGAEQRPSGSDIKRRSLGSL